MNPANVDGNPLGMRGIAFVDFATPRPDELHALFRALGFSRLLRHARRPVDLDAQNGIVFLLNTDPDGFAARFGALHGPSIASLGWAFDDPERALAGVEENAGGALRVEGDDARDGRAVPAIEGIGGSRIYFLEPLSPRDFGALGFVPHPDPDVVPGKGFLGIDHLTNNVEEGALGRWSDFYRRLFGFREIRYFDVRGAATGLRSYALRSPCGSFAIPINEGTEEKSQINEYLVEYGGPGVQHLAFLTDDILASLEALDGCGVETLDIDPDYYDDVFARVPGVREDPDRLRARGVLVDGDADGYLLQIFTRPVVGPIFVEIIQRRDHASFGEGNFGALFRSLERDQARRGVL